MSASFYSSYLPASCLAYISVFGVVVFLIGFVGVWLVLLWVFGVLVVGFFLVGCFVLQGEALNSQCRQAPNPSGLQV